MLLNKLTVIYGLFLACSLVVGGIASVYGLTALFGRRSDDSAERRQHWEKYLYLCTSAMFVGALIRLIMIPLWFFMLHKLIPSIPGAMCLAGVHLNVPKYGWPASSMKLLLPWLYFSWIFITRLDRRIVAQPYFKLRQILLIPLLLFLFIEAYLDIRFLTGLTPTPVTCCTAIFDFNTKGVPPILTETHWYFVFLFLAALVMQALSLRPSTPGRWVHLATPLLAMLLFVSLLLALHTKLSPLILESPFHHCIFCLLENNPAILSGFILLLLGIYMSFAYGLAAWTNHEAMATLGVLRSIKITISIAYIAGTALIAVYSLHYLFAESGGY